MAELTRYWPKEWGGGEGVMIAFGGDHPNESDVREFYYRADEVVAFLRDMAKHHEELDRPYHADALNDFADTLEKK